MANSPIKLTPVPYFWLWYFNTLWRTVVSRWLEGGAFQSTRTSSSMQPVSSQEIHWKPRKQRSYTTTPPAVGCKRRTARSLPTVMQSLLERCNMLISWQLFGIVQLSIPQTLGALDISRSRAITTAVCNLVNPHCTGRFKCCVWCVPLHVNICCRWNFLQMSLNKKPVIIFLRLMRQNHSDLLQAVTCWVLGHWLVMTFGIEKNLTWAMFSPTVSFIVWLLRPCTAHSLPFWLPLVDTPSRNITKRNVHNSNIAAQKLDGNEMNNWVLRMYRMICRVCEPCLVL